jgi:hypothetical protein
MNGALREVKVLFDIFTNMQSLLNLVAENPQHGLRRFFRINTKPLLDWTIDDKPVSKSQLEKLLFCYYFALLYLTDAISENIILFTQMKEKTIRSFSVHGFMQAFANDYFSIVKRIKEEEFDDKEKAEAWAVELAKTSQLYITQIQKIVNDIMDKFTEKAENATEEEKAAQEKIHGKPLSDVLNEMRERHNIDDFLEFFMCIINVGILPPDREPIREVRLVKENRKAILTLYKHFMENAEESATKPFLIVSATERSGETPEE